MNATPSSSRWFGLSKARLFIWVIWLSSTRGSVACPQYERNYLLDFKGAVTQYDNTSLESWQGFNCCEWKGVTCTHDLDSTHVTKLDLFDFYLQGEIHSSLFELEYLQHLDLRLNSFTKIPSDIGKLRKLTLLDLSEGTWKGEIPMALANLQDLRYLAVGAHSDDPDWQPLQTPRFSSWLQNLTRLEHLSLNGVGIYPKEASSEWGEVITTLSNLTHLEMYDCRLSGQLPPSIANLSRLVTLGLGGNYLTGVIPPSLGNLSALNSLDLAGNKLNGTIPSSISKLVRLTLLDLSSNSLGGHISFSSFDDFTSLQDLDLSHNQLSVSIASTWMPNFNGLNSLGLDSCNLVEIPPFLVTQYGLTSLHLSGNNMLGSVIPTWIWDLPLFHLNLSSNQLTGSLPSRQIFNHLLALDLHNNSLQGALPLIGRSDNQFGIPILLVDMSDNQFSSSIPSDFGEYLQGVVFLSLSGNRIPGKIPNSICSSSVHVLDLSNNMLSGIVSPDLTANCLSLRVLNLGNNSLEGRMPGFQNTSRLETLNLNGNLFQGAIASSLANCSFLKVLDMGNNNLEGHIPKWIGNLSNLRILILKSNKFQGNIPKQIIGLKKLQILDLSHNNLSGFIPMTLQNLSAMVNASQNSSEHLAYRPNTDYSYYNVRVTISTKDRQFSYGIVLSIFKFMDLSSNNLWGNIPAEMGTLSGLKGLNLSRNNLTGEIPRSLGGMEQLESLDLSFNKLNGKIPMELQSLSYLQVFNVSYNMLEGKVPQGGQFLTFDESSFAGNRNLSDIPFTNMFCDCNSPWTNRACNRSACNGEDRKRNEEGEDQDSSFEMDWWGLSVGLCFALGFSLVIAALALNLKIRKSVFRIYDGIILRIFPRN